MNHNPASVRLFRVTGARVVNSNLVIEDVERAEFEYLGGFGIDDAFLAEVSGTANVDKFAFCALDALRRRGLYGYAAELAQHMPRSIDEAVDQAEDKAEALMRERAVFRERWRREHPIGESEPKEAPGAPTETRSAVGKGSDPVITGEWVEPSPEEQRRIVEQAKQHIRDVWSYGRGKRLEWKRAGRTPRGREYGVLTVDGAEQLYPGPTSIETSPPKWK
ncbi:MAG TPA: hypothetical protein VJX67_20210 [Blastocatellia bacterium]|nr:hypothetical protein [Blastocatellia bacterium]